MFTLIKRNGRSASLAILSLVFFFSAFGFVARAQEGNLFPPPESSVEDFASVVDYGMTRRLENMLANLETRAGIDLVIVIVKTTGGTPIFDYSQRVAREWDIGAIQSKEKSMLLVVSTDDGKFFMQVSRRVRGDLPDGLIGEMGSRMREPFSKGHYGEGVLAGVETFIAKIAERRGFSLEGIDQAQAQAQEQAPVQVAQPAPTPAESPKQIAEPTDTLPREQPAEAARVTATPPPENLSPKEPVPQPSPVKKPSLRDIFTKVPTAREPVTNPLTIAHDTPEKAELDRIVVLEPAERIEKLKAFIEGYPRSPLKAVASELIVSARAALGDEKLKAGDAAGGVEQFRLAIAESPEKMSDALFARVVSQVPLNLFLRGERAAALEAARQIEAKVKDDPKRLLALAGFFLSIEDASEAARLSEIVIKLTPEMAAAHHALGASRHIGLQLDDAATEYARALELDPKLIGARRSLADLRRATGKSDEALALYREQLTIDPSDKAARAGVVLSLLDLGKKEEAESELAAALKDDPRNMALLVGASYWHAAKGDAARAQELATKAIEIEPRYTWAHIALSRALVAQKRALEAERVLRFARRYGNFPTLDYELASALAVSGLYEEAAGELARSFTIKGGQIEARLAGRVPAQAADFLELLAPERRAGIFQAAAADTEANARMLKGLLAFTSMVNPTEGRSVDAAALASAQADFLAGEDGMLAYRQLYAASRLLSRGVELNTVAELAEAAKGHVEAALDVPLATVAVMADELRDARARAVSSGGVLAVGELQRNVLANILRGRIEDITGWAFFNQDRTSEALTHLRRGLSVLPENSAWWRKTQWHLGATLEATGNRQEALAAYLKGYDASAPNLVQRAIIEALYRKVYGSLDGLDEKIGAAPFAPADRSGNASETPQPSEGTTPSAPPESPTSQTEQTPSAPIQTPSTDQSGETKLPANEQPKPESTEQKPVQGTHPIRQP